MTTYTPNIPQPTDDPSNSQDQILQNFQTLNTLYGTSGDHYPWTNTAPGISGRHAKVTLPGLPTAGSAPGTALPTPSAGEGSMFALTAGSQSFPFWRRDSGTSNYPIVITRAMGRVTSAGAIVGNAFNIASCVVAPAGVFTFTLTNAEPDANYLVLATPTGQAAELGCTSFTTTTFVITSSPTAVGLTVQVLRYTL